MRSPTSTANSMTSVAMPTIARKIHRGIVAYVTLIPLTRSGRRGAVRTNRGLMAAESRTFAYWATTKERRAASECPLPLRAMRLAT